MGRVADPLREYAEKFGSMDFGGVGRQLLSIADQIDREHAIRMEQSKRDTKHAFARYLRSIMEDYDRRSIKRKVPRKVRAIRYIGSRDTYCRCGCKLSDGQAYCHSCGAKIREPMMVMS